MRLVLFLFLFVFFQFSMAQRIDSLPELFSFERKDTIEYINLKYDTCYFTNRNIKGIDVSVWQGNINWKHINNQKDYSFIFIRASYGLKKDIYFDINWENCSLKKGTYHFFDPLISGITQGKFILKNIDFKTSDLPIVIDVEKIRKWKRCNRKKAVLYLIQLLNYIEDKTGVRPIIYTNPNFWNRYIHLYFKGLECKYKLWVAHYFVNEPNLPLGWSDWTFWQYSHKGKVHDDGYWDLNIYNGEDLNKILVR